MSAAENIATAQRGYAAFGAGDAAGAMADMVDDIEWITPGNSAISGTTHGKQELGANWAQLARRASPRPRSTGTPTRSASLC